MSQGSICQRVTQFPTEFTQVYKPAVKPQTDRFKSFILKFVGSCTVRHTTDAERKEEIKGEVVREREKEEE